MAVMGACLAGPASGQIGAFGPGGPAATHPPGLKDGWLKTFGSSQGQGDFAAEAAAAGYGLVAMGGEYRGTLLDQSGATVAPTSASSGQTYFPAAFVAAAEADGTNFWSRGMVGETTGGLRGSARTNAVAFAHPNILANSTLFAAGWYQNKVEFDTVGSGLQRTAVGTSVKDCFIASFGVAADALYWVKTFPSVTSTANDEIFGVAVSPEFVVPDGGQELEPWPGDYDPTEDPSTGEAPEGPDPMAEGISVIAVAGGFHGTIDFDEANPGAARETAIGGEDGFVVLLDQTSGNYLAHITFGSTGDDRAFDVIVAPDPIHGPNPPDRSSHVIYVCGFYSNGASFPPISGTASSAGGRDLFVAVISVTSNSGAIVMKFDHLYTYGTGGNDVARALAGGVTAPVPFTSPSGSAAFSRLAFTGWTRGGLPGGRDLVAGVLHDLDVGVFDLQWQHELTENDDTDDAGLDVAWDRLSRVVVAGQCGVERSPSGSATTAIASFDPAGADQKTTAGGWDGVLARYAVNGDYLDAAIYGHNYNDWASSLVIDRDTEQVWLTGVFGHPNAPSTYNVGFGTSLPGSGRGGADMFWLSLEAADPPPFLDAMVSIVIDTSGSMLPGGEPWNNDFFDDVKASLAKMFREEPFTVRRTGSLAFNIVAFGYHSAPVARELVPWTVIDESTAKAFGSMVESMSPFGGSTPLWLGLDVALDQCEASPLLSLVDEDHRLMIVIGDGCENVFGIHRQDIESRMQTLGWPAEVAGISLGDVTIDCPNDPGTGLPMAPSQYYAEQVVTLSQATGALQLHYHADETSDPLDPTHFEYQIRRVLKELTCCLADFDADGMHDILTDEPAFYALFDPPVGDPHPAADLNRDGQWDPSDETLFYQYLQLDCPCGQ